MNDLLASKRWKVERAWHWKRRSHINVLETGTVTSLAHELVSKQPDTRHNVLVDSTVAQGSIAKGRSSAVSLKPSLKKLSTYQIAGGLQLGLSFAPTRGMPADHPTRDNPMPDPCHYSLIPSLRAFDWQAIHHQKLPRYLANWVRLSLLMCLINLPPGVEACQSGGVPREEISGFNLFLPSTLDFLLLLYRGFSSVLGSSLPLFLRFPSQIINVISAWTFFVDQLCLFCRSSCFHGLSIFGCFLSLLLLLGLCSSLSVVGSKGSPRIGFPRVALLAMVCVDTVGAPLAPISTADEARAAARAGIRLASDRVIRQETRSTRYELLDLFGKWLFEEHQIELNQLLQSKPVDAEFLANILASYGRDMHRAGRAYGKYAETINALAMMKPIVKRQLTSAWDVAFAWLQDEPQDHHPAMPATVLLSIVSLSLLWGWATEAALFSLCWAGILRVGEVIGARRADLVLPSDGPPGCKCLWLRIKEPKTRGRGARHQAAKVDAADLVALISGVFGSFESDQLLWGFSAQTLRKRLLKLLAVIGLPTTKTSSSRPYELSSLRPGGATFLLNLTENPDLVRRRGRWASIKVMEIYLQEVAVATGVNKLDAEVREKIKRLSDAFPEILQQSLKFLRCAIPCKAWYVLFQHHQGQEDWGKMQ